MKAVQFFLLILLTSSAFTGSRGCTAGVFVAIFPGLMIIKLRKKKEGEGKMMVGNQDDDLVVKWMTILYLFLMIFS